MPTSAGGRVPGPGREVPGSWSRRRFLARAGLLTGGAAWLGRSVGAAEPAGRAGPGLNVVVILADDLGWADLACYGHRLHETPNLGRLAAQGMRFTDAYAACPVCSPTRASILTGQYPARLHLTDWIAGRRSQPADRLRGPAFRQELPLECTTLAEALTPAGYGTASVGKWHLGGAGFLPENQGFGLNVAGTHLGSPAGGYFLPNQMHLPNAKPGEYLTDRLAEEGAGFIAAQAGRGPFLLYQAFHVVHTPLQAKKEYIARYEARKVALGVPGNTTYAGMVQSLDDGVGRLLRALDEAGMTDRTLVVFTSDNGGFLGATSNAPLRAGKGYLYEGGTRVPLIVRWPGVTAPGSECRVPVSSVDLLPTVLEACGRPALPGVDGVSLTPLLRAVASPARDTLFWHYPHYSPQGGKPGGAVRRGDLKLIEFYEDNRVELYDVRQDIGEGRDLAGERPAEAAALRQVLAAWRQAVGADMPTPNPAYRPGPAAEAQSAAPPGPGSRDAEFAVLSGARVDESALGYAVGATEAGLALHKLDREYRARVRFRVRLQSLQPDHAPRAWRNGFLVFGAGPAEADLVSCGVYLGGRRQYAILEGTLATASPASQAAALTADPYTVFDLEVSYDPATREVVLQHGQTRLVRTLSRPLPAVRYVGYAVTGTTTAFSRPEIAELP